MSIGVNNLYEFGSFRLDAESRTLWRGNEVVSLSPKAAELLKLLVERDGQIVSRQEIFDIVWADTFVEDGVLTQNVYTLRHTLGLDENGKQIIETVPRRGYRFAGQVKKLSTEEIAAVNGHKAKAAYDGSDLSAELHESNLGLSFSGHVSRSAVKKDAPLKSASALVSRKRLPISFLLFAGLGILILAAGFGVYQFVFRANDNSKSNIAPIEQLRFQSLTDTGDVIHPTISPDGEFLAFVRVEEEQASVWVKQMAAGGAVQTLPPSRKGYRSLAYSSDGKYLFFREQADPGSIYQTSPFGGAQKRMADNVWSDFSVSPDDRQFAFIRRDHAGDAHLLILSNVDGSGERELCARQSQMGYIGGAPAWSPDGTKLVLTGTSQHEARPVLLNVDVATGQETELKSPRWHEITRILWTPNGKHLIVAARAPDEAASQVWMLSFPDGEVRRLTNDLESYFWLSLSADGRMLMTRQQRIVSHLWLLPQGDIKKASQITFGGRNFDAYLGIAWTPDGKIVFSSRSGHSTDLYSINPDGSGQVQLTANAGKANTWPAVSRAMPHIVFTSLRTGATQIWRMDSDGRNQKQLTFGEGPRERAHSPALSPDGKEVFFIKLGAGPAAIWKVSIEGGEAVPFSRLTGATAESFLSISPDGKWLAYRHVSARQESSGEDRTMQIGVLPTDGSSAPKLFDLPLRRPMVQWSVDSAALHYAVGAFNSSSLWRQPLAGGEPQKLLDFPDRVFSFSWSPDGKNLAVARGKIRGDAVLITNLP